jgi:hypothetical protein
LSNWSVFADLNGDEVLNNPKREGFCEETASEPCAVSREDGTFELRNLPARSFLIKQVVQPGWRQSTNDLPRISNQQSGFQLVDQNFGNSRDGEQHSIYFPYFEGDETNFTAFALSNYSDQPVSLLLKVFGADGDPLDYPDNPVILQLRRQGQLARLGRELFGGALPDPEPGWVELKASHTDLGSFFQVGNSRVTRLDGSVAFEEACPFLIFTRLSEIPGEITTYLSIANPGDNPVTVDLYLTDLADSLWFPIAIQTVQIPAHGLLYGSVEEIMGSTVAQGCLDAWVVEEDGLITGFAMIVKESVPDFLIGLNGICSMGEPAVYSAQLASGSNLFTSLKIANYQEPQILDLEAIDEKGDLITGTQAAISAGEQFQFDVGDLFALDPKETVIGSLQIHSDGTGIVGDILFGFGDPPTAAANLPFQSAPFTHAVFSHVANGAGYYTGLALYNPNSVFADVTVEIYDPDGLLTGTGLFTLAPWNRTARLLNELIPSTAGQVGGYVIVRSTEPIIGQQLFGSSSLSLLSAVPPKVIE